MKKVSIITIVYNNVKSIENSIMSVLSQKYNDIEYIIIDGGSTDGTVEVIRKYIDKISVFVTESDKGIYDALNKGINSSSGDIIGILHSDDTYSDENVVSDMIETMTKNNSEIGFSDMVIINDEDQKIFRHYMASYFKVWMFKIGWMPPHPTCFISKTIFNEFGLYSLDYKITGDFDFLVRIFYQRSIRWAYLNRVTVRMALNGVSNASFSGKLLIWKEINKSLKANKVNSVGIFQIARYFIRFLEILVSMKPSKK